MASTLAQFADDRPNLAGFMDGSQDMDSAGRISVAPEDRMA